jgi:transposase InsO family protein
VSTPPSRDGDDAAPGDPAVHGDGAPARRDDASESGGATRDASAHGDGAAHDDDARGESAARDDDAARVEALFRYHVIAPLLDEREHGSLRARITALAGERHPHPRRGEIAITGRTLWTWLARFRRGGIDALRPRHRRDRGRLRAVPGGVLERAEVLRRQVPQRWTSTVIDILVREGAVTTAKRPHRATIDRHLRRRGASRRQLLVLGGKPTIKMKFGAFGDLWVGDYHHGPKVLAPDGRLTTAKLGAFIDHTTRYPVADRWYLAEDLGSLRDTMLRAVLVWGPPGLAYADRGAVYRAEQLAYSLAALGARLVHSRAYYSQGRGVIERWWQLADAFQVEIDDRDEPVTLHELNRLWEAFRTFRYLEVPHSALGMSPAQAIAAVTPRPIDPAVARELFLVRADRTVNRKDATVSVEGRRFLCDAALRGRKVTVRYDPRELSSVLVFVDGVRTQRALPQPFGPTGDATTAPPPPPSGPKTDYLGMVRADFDRRLVEAARPVAYADLGAIDPGFDESRFFTVVADLTGARLRDAEAVEVRAFWTTFGPLPERLARTALDHAVLLRGTGRHVRVYLAIVRTFVLARMQSPNPEESP